MIDAPATSEKAIYVDAATLGGAPLTAAKLTHAQLAGGALLRFDMSDAPGPWGQVP